MCDNQQLAKAYHLKLHYVKCSAAHQLPEVKHTHEQPITMKRDRSPLPPPAKCQTLCTPITSIQPDMDTHIVKTSTNHKNAIDLQVASMLVISHSMLLNIHSLRRL